MKRSVETQDSIIRAAVRCLSSNGVGAFTVGTVARRAGVSSALVHYHFATKQRLLAAAAERLLERRTAERLGALGGGAGLGALDRLWQATQDFLILLCSLRAWNASSLSEAWRAGERIGSWHC